MRIDAYNQVSQIYKTSGKVKTTKSTASSGKDKLEISDFGKAYQVAKKAVEQAPDVRSEKVADIKARIQNGTYNVTSESFADKLLQSYNA